MFPDGGYQWGHRPLYQVPQLIQAPPGDKLRGQPWIQWYHSDGRPYWYNPETRESVWQIPDELKQAAVTAAEEPAPFINIGGGGGGYYAYDRTGEEQMLEQVRRLSIAEAAAAGTDAAGPSTQRVGTPNTPQALREARERNLLSRLGTPSGHKGPNPSNKCRRCSSATGLQRVPCGCRYCSKCIITLFAEYWDKDMYEPPRCCNTDFPPDLVNAAIEIETESKAAGGSGSRRDGRIATPAASVQGCSSRDKGKGKAIPLYECVACMDEFQDVMIAKCKHNYCRPCMARLFMETTRNEGLFPPSCCKQEIPITWANLVLNPKEQDEFYEKSNEWRTKDRLYCSVKKCSAFIAPMLISTDSGTGTCRKCYAQTCVHCKEAAHKDVCKKDKNHQGVLDLADQSGWKRCYSCNDMVELTMGCNHITCRCGAEFCYTCGAKWHTCHCQLWREDNLRDVLRQQFGPNYQIPAGAIGPGAPAGEIVPGPAEGVRIAPLIGQAPVLQPGALREPAQWMFHDGLYYRRVQDTQQVLNVPRVEDPEAPGRRMMWDPVNGWRIY